MSKILQPATHLAGLLLACVSMWVSASSGAAVEIDLAQVADPIIEPPEPVPDVASRPLPLWIEALSAPEMDLRREAADTIVLAHELKMPGLDTAVPALIQALSAPDQHPLVVAAVARTLMVLDARQAAPALFARAKAGNLDLAQQIEPALARWSYDPIRPIWRKRLADRDTRRVLLLLAIEGLTAVGDKEAGPLLKDLALRHGVEPPIRLAAARGLGKLEPEGLEIAADELAADPSPERMVDRLVAASLLRRHESQAALQVLMKLALDPEPSVAAAALQPLVERDFRRILPVADQLAASDDANVRHLTAQAWVAERTVGAIALLGKLLDDPNPGVRAYVRESLLAMTSDAALREAVLESAKSMLAGRQWRGLEQSVMIVVALDRKETADRLVELLEFERPEVFVAAAWGLRRLGVPSTCPAILTQAEQLRAAQKSSRNAPGFDRQFCHLAEALGLMRYNEALPLLTQYVPKDFSIDHGVRASAIWAIGHILADKPDPDLVTALCARVADVAGIMPEAFEVRTMAAVTLGRMQAASALPTLRQFYDGKPVGVAPVYACGWAIHMMTGEPLPVFVQLTFGRGQWFLQPLDR